MWSLNSFSDSKNHEAHSVIPRKRNPWDPIDDDKIFNYGCHGGLMDLTTRQQNSWDPIDDAKIFVCFMVDLTTRKN